MTRITRLGLIAVLAVAAVAAPCFAADVTVGHFYTEIAKAKQITAVDAASAEAGLRAAGISLPDLALGKSLTEGDVASISNAFGLSVTTSKPTELVSDSQLNQFVSAFSSQVGGAPDATKGNALPAETPRKKKNGKVKQTGHKKTTAEPA